MSKKALTTAAQNQQLQCTTAEDVPAAIAALQAQLSEVKGNAPEEVKTDGEWEGGLLLKNAKVSQLLEMQAALIAREAAYKKVAKSYKGILPNPPEFKINGFNSAAWKSDISKAIYESINSQTVTKLETAISQLQEHLSADEKLKATLSGIMNMASQIIE